MPDPQFCSPFLSSIVGPLAGDSADSHRGVWSSVRGVGRPAIVLACLVLSALLPGASHAQATTPDGLVRRAQAQAKRPEGVIPLLELLHGYDRFSSKATLAALSELSSDRNLSPPRRLLAQRLLAQVVERRGDPQAAQAGIESLGFLSKFRVVGGFDNEGKQGVEELFGPEKERMAAPDLEAAFEGKDRPVSWRSLPSEVVRLGQVPLGVPLQPSKNVCAYAETFVYLERPQVLSLWFGAGGASRVYWNGALALEDRVYRQSPFPDRAAGMVSGVLGWNRLLVKECVSSEPMAFFVRLGGRDGGPLSGLRLSENTPAALDIVAGKQLGNMRKPKVALDELTARATRRRAQGKDHVALARYLRLTGSDDRSVQRARQLATQAATKHANPAWLAFAASMSSERGDKMRLSQLATRRFPSDVRSQLLEIELAATGPTPESALPMLDKLSSKPAYTLATASVRAGLLSRLGFSSAALSVLLPLRTQFADVPGFLRLLANIAASAPNLDLAYEVRNALLKVRFDDQANRRVIIEDLLARGEHAEVRRHLDVLQNLRPANPGAQRYAASVLDGLGRDDLALSTYRHAMLLSPERADVHFDYAQSLIRAQQPELAAKSLQTVLKLAPQHRRADELLRHLRPKPRADEAFAMGSSDFLAQRGEGEGRSVTVLQRLQVNTVFDNGLGTRFSQLAAQAHDDQGARKLRVHSIQYDPETQRVDLRRARVYRRDGRVLESIRTFEQSLGEPWYRIYYDTRALVVVLPDLEPGDVVELQYRVDDIASRNRFSDYFGDMHFFGGDRQTLNQQYILVTPSTRKFFTSRPQWPGMAYEDEVADGRRTQRWSAQDLPAVVSEQSMPGMTEVVPYLHVSTYQTWQQVGKWYWGLIKDQLYADVSLRKVVAELVAGETTTLGKVQRIHDWVLDHTRYVGLEFGIHGFLPYRVPLIVQRGFGDCKDKASLLYTMFKEAGVDARIVLVRTRRNGNIEDLPASLSVFDHAIAYVPELDLFIDGTAEQSGLRELPPQDQGVTVLVVGPQESRLTKTPVLPPSARKRTRELVVHMQPNGSASVAGEETIEGTEAAGLRSQYDAIGTRNERFERAYGGMYPGLALEELSIGALDNREIPVSMSYRFSAPALGSREGRRIRVPASTITELTRSMAPTATRKHELDLQTTSAYEETRTVVVPEGFRIGKLPSGGRVKNKHFELELMFLVEDDRVIARTQFVLRRDRVLVEDYAEYRAEVLSADALLRSRIELEQVSQ